MLEKLDLTKRLEKEEYKKKMEVLEPRLGELQRKCREMGIPVMIAFEGYDAAGKGLQIGKIASVLYMNFTFPPAPSPVPANEP